MARLLMTALALACLLVCDSPAWAEPPSTGSGPKQPAVAHNWTERYDDPCRLRVLDNPPHPSYSNPRLNSGRTWHLSAPVAALQWQT